MAETRSVKATVAGLGMAAFAITFSGCSGFNLTAPSSGAESVQRQALQTCEHEQTGTLELRNNARNRGLSSMDSRLVIWRAASIRSWESK